MSMGLNGRRRVVHTGHELNNMHVSLAENQLHVFRITLLQLALQVSATVLVLAQAVQLTLVMLQRVVAETSELSRIILLATLNHVASGYRFTKPESSTIASIGIAVCRSSCEVLHVAVDRGCLADIWLDSIIEGRNRRDLEWQPHLNNRTTNMGGRCSGSELRPESWSIGV